MSAALRVLIASSNGSIVNCQHIWQHQLKSPSKKDSSCKYPNAFISIFTPKSVSVDHSGSFTRCYDKNLSMEVKNTHGYLQTRKNHDASG